MGYIDFGRLEMFLENGFFVVLSALFLTLLAFLVAYFAQEAVDHLTQRWRDRLGDAVSLPGQLAYLLVLLLFAPSIFERLGVSSVTEPIVRSMQELFMFVPNLVGAVLILAIGSMVAKMIRALLNGCIGSFVTCCGAKLKPMDEFSFDKAKVQEWVSSFIYILVMFPVVIAALETLRIDALTKPAVGILNRCLMFIPNLFVGLLLLGIGVLVARFVSDLLKKMLVGVGMDEKVKALTGCACFAGVLSCILEAVVVLFFAVEALNVLNLLVLTRVGNAIIAYLPNLVASALIALAAYFGASATRKAMHGNGVPGLGRILQAIIYVFAGFMVLSQLGISSYIVNTAFTCAMFGVTVAFVLAFGIGGREAAGRMLNRLLQKECSCHCDKKDDLQQELPFEKD